VANGLVVTIAPSASGSQADAAGVLAMGTLTVTAPSLNVVLSPPNMILSWPTNASGFVLNQTSSLVSPITWTPVTSGITVSGGNYTITINTRTGARFYALIAPYTTGFRAGKLLNRELPDSGTASQRITTGAPDTIRPIRGRV
jgi:hypothetical protein